MKLFPAPARRQDMGRWLVVALLTAVCNYGCARLGYTFALRPSGVVILWMPAGFVLALLVLLPRRDWPAAVLGAIIGNAFADAQHGATIATAILGGSANAIESLLAAWFTVRVAGPRMSLGSLREVGTLAIGAALATNALSALVGGLLLWKSRPYAEAWFIWWSGDGVGMLVVAPVILTLTHAVRAGRRMSWVRCVEAAVVLSIMAAAAYALFADGPTAASPLGQHPYLALPLLHWGAVRFGPRGAASGTLVLAVVAIIAATHQPAWGASAVPPVRSVLVIYSFLALASVTSLVIASVVNERARAEGRLVDSEQYLREMTEHIRDAFFMVDLTSERALYVSPTWSTIWGRPMAEAYDPSIWFHAIHEDDRRAMAASMAAVKNGENTETEFRVIRPDGSQRWVRGRAFPVRDAKGRVYRMTGVSTDVTELHDAEERFTQAQKMEAVGRLAGGVAHDFNNLLTVILGDAYELRQTVTPTHESEELLTSITAAGESAASLTRQLLAFSRKQIVRPTVFALNDAVEATSKMLRRLIGEDVTLELRLGAKTGFIHADPGQLEQVLTNLAVNARDAMPDGGALAITTGSTVLDEEFVRSNPGSRAGEYVTLSVSDSGIGMPPAVAARVFEPFFTTKELGHGTGLGLATCYGVVKQANGYITVESAVGTGTTFRVYLPKVEAGAAEDNAVASVLPVGTETVLLVEDEAAVRRVASRILNGLGYTVIEATDALGAHRLLVKTDTKIDLLLTDLVMPGMTGRELAELVTAIHPDIAVLFMTGYTGDVVMQQQLGHRDADIVHKPFTADTLANTVRDALDRASARRQDAVLV